jgi:hypothetical protein
MNQSPIHYKNEGKLKFPSLNSLYSMFSPRSKLLNVWCLGFTFGAVEADLQSSLGCEIKIFDNRKDAKERYTIFKRVMTDHTVNDDDPYWIKNMVSVWTNMKRYHFAETLPWSFNAILDLSGNTVETKKINESETERVDICKIDYPDFEIELLQGILKAGYRPGLIYIRWTNHPDTNTNSMLAAGHLQTLGYELIGEADNYFLYYFNDECYYECCSWADTKVKNPMITEILQNK